MKRVFGFALAVFVVCGVDAAYPRGAQVDYYSPDGGLYYRGVQETKDESRSFISKSSHSWVKNVQVFDLKSGDTWMIFAKDLSSHQSVTDVVFERTEPSISTRSLRNAGESKNPKDRLLVIVVDSELRVEELWTANMKGENPRKIAAVSEKQDWHIDVLNGKVRVFSKTETGFQMHEYEW